MRKVAALALALAAAMFAVPASPAAARGSRHPHAKVRCSARSASRGRHAAPRCRTARRRRVRARFALVSSPRPRSSTPTRPRSHFALPSNPVHCDLFASPSGSDNADGTIGNPYATLRKLDGALSPGQTGCLRGGSYGDINTWHELASSGNQSQRITITAYPGESPTVVGWIDIEGSYTTVSHLHIDGSNTFYHTSSPRSGCSSVASQGLAIAGTNVIFEYNDYYQSVASLRANGLGVGWTSSPDNAIIRFNKIHDVGRCQDYDHLIYLSHGNNVQIYDNWMWGDKHGWGVQLYPAPTNARVWGNVIDGAGAGFTVGSEQGETSGNKIFNNVVMNSTGLPNANLSGVAISDYWGGSRGSGNSFSANDSFNNPGGVARVSVAVGLDSNTTADPNFVDASGHNYALQAGSPVSSYGLWAGSVA